MVRLLTVCSIFLCLSQAEKLNVCTQLIDYFLPTPEHCWHNPDLWLTPAQIAHNHNYRFETHETITDDGYMLAIFRVLGISAENTPENAPVVFLQHGMFCTSKAWLSLGNNSLAFKLADAGFDVWLGNFRGTVYSRKHVLSYISEMNYWDFTFYHLGYFDLDAMLTYVANKTRRKIIYIGHSLGGASVFIYAMEKHAKNLATIIGLAPVAIMKNKENIFEKLAPHIEIISKLVTILKYNHLGISSLKTESLFIKFCSGNIITVNICNVVLFTLLTIIQENLPPQYFPMLASQFPAGTALQVLKHLPKELGHQGLFRHYNYNPVINRKKYHQIEPPLYEINKIDIPMYLFYGAKDLIADEKDVKLFYDSLTTEKYLIEMDYTHLDFLFGAEPDDLLAKLLSILENFKDD